MNQASSPATNGRILIVDDEPDMASGLRTILRRQKFDVETALSAEQALEKLKEEPVDLVLTDLMLPGLSGIELLERIKQSWPDTFVVVFTGYATVESAVQAVRLGAFDYISKPFTPQQLEVVVSRVFRHKALSDENRDLRKQIRDRFSFESLVGVSEAMKKVHGLLGRVASTEASVLIIGESGTGKELIARAVHANSRRANKSFVPLDCAALPQSLLESELFGYEKGAFTGAATSRAGLLEAANGGTFFMDEIGELDLSMQVKLLRVLQERQFRRVGGSKIITVDVRIVAATNRDLEKEVKAGRFREDLYHRLNVIQVRLPPLRERTGDVPLLVHHFLHLHGERIGKPDVQLTHEAMQALELYPWPGNVRELQNAIEYSVSMSDGLRIGMADLPHSVQSYLRERGPVLAAPERPESGGAAVPSAAFVSATGQGMSPGSRSFTDAARRPAAGSLSTAAPGASMPGALSGTSMPGAPASGPASSASPDGAASSPSSGPLPVPSSGDAVFILATGAPLPAGANPSGNAPRIVEVHHELPYKKAKRKWLESFEREYFIELLKRHDFNISHAARAAQIDRKSIQRILKKNNLEIGRIVEEE